MRELRLDQTTCACWPGSFPPHHDALADVLATAQMLPVSLHQADTLEMRCPTELLEMQHAQHWLWKR